MFRPTLVLALALAAGTVFATACGDDDPTPVNDSGIVLDSGICLMPYEGPTVPAEAACTAAADQTAAARTDYTYTPAGGSETAVTFRNLASACAQECATSTAEDCVELCISRNLDGDTAAPSAGCQTCYVTSAGCAVENCVLAGCATDPTSQNCINCVCGKNTGSIDCIGDFVECSGIASTTCTAGNACLDD